ncbi:MAG: hypothetical protein NVSMB16_16410 [Acidimicrobiales bacterium]
MTSPPGDAACGIVGDDKGDAITAEEPQGGSVLGVEIDRRGPALDGGDQDGASSNADALPGSDGFGPDVDEVSHGIKPTKGR